METLRKPSCAFCIHIQLGLVEYAKDGIENRTGPLKVKDQIGTCFTVQTRTG